VRAHLPGELETLRIDIRRNYARCTGGAANADSEDSDRTAAGDEHRSAGDVRGERCVKRISHGIMYAADIVADRIVEVPYVRRGHCDELGETSIAIDADDLRVRADMRISSAAEKAASVDDVALGGDAISLLYISDETTDLDYITGEFMADNEWRRAA
jgi:hypothetical protein